jgi:ABC-type transporter Mla subunit MlaD
MKSGAEIKVGIVVVAALVVLGLIVYFLVGTVLARVGYPVEVVFDRADVSSGDSVLMSGVPIGRVESVVLTEQSRALVTLRIDRGVKIHTGYTVHIVAGSLLGENFVEIRTVPPKQAGAVVPPGGKMHGEPYVRIDDIVSSATGLLGNLNETTKDMDELLRSERMQGAIRNSISNLGQAAHDMAALARELRGMAVEARPRVARVLANVDAVSADLRETSQILAEKLRESEIPENLEETSRRILSAVERVDDLVAQFQELATQPEMHDMVMTAARNLRDTSETVRQAAEEIRTAAANANAASGSIAEAAKDAPTITSNIRDASANIRDASADIKGMASEARESLPEVTGNAAKAVKAIGGIPPIRANLNIGTQYLTHEGRWWIDANADVMSGERLLRVGVADLGETDRFNLQLGQQLGPGTIRYGVIQSQAGLGYDWPLTPWLTLSGEVFDPNELRANIFGYWGIGGALRGWDVVAGYRGAGRAGGSPVVGVRLER